MFVLFPLRFGYLYHIFSLISFCLCDSLIWNLKDFRSLVFLPPSKSFKFCYGLTDWLPAAPILCFNNDRAFRIKLLVSLSWVGVKAILCIRGDSFRAFESASHFFSMKDPKLKFLSIMMDCFRRVTCTPRLFRRHFDFLAAKCLPRSLC